jgi:hypothetical protein
MRGAAAGHAPCGEPLPAALMAPAAAQVRPPLAEKPHARLEARNKLAGRTIGRTLSLSSMRRLGRLARAALVAPRRGAPPLPPAAASGACGGFRNCGRVGSECRTAAGALSRLPCAGLHSAAAAGAPSGVAGAAPAAQKAARAQEESLVVEVVTGDVRGGGCAAPASLTFFGEHGARLPDPQRPLSRRCADSARFA